MVEDGTGYDSEHRVDLIRSDDRNFRPVDMEFAPDGSLYFVDWHNILVGHMQHNARDPLRDHVHGRIYRITYPSRPLVTPPTIDGASIETLLGNLKLPEFRARYATRTRYEHHLLEGLWVSWGLNAVDQDLLKKLMDSEDHRVRAAVARILRYTGHQIPDQVDLLKKAAADPHGRVRLEAIVAASWLNKEDGLAILEVANEHPKDDWMQKPFETSLAHLNGMSVKNMVVNPDGSVVFQEAAKEAKASNSRLKGEELTLFQMGKAIYSREGFCITCHQPDGKGLSASGFPPLAGTKWVNGNEERFIKIVLNGLMGPIEVLGKDYPGQVPMTPYGGMLNDKEVAAVITYVRNSFGNEASAISPDKVKAVRAAIKDKTGFYSPTELLQEHPMEKE